MEQVHLKYGTSAVDFEVDGAKSVKYLYENKMRVIEDIKAEFLYCVTDGVIGTKPLKELIAPTDPVTIVISDMTRFWMRQDVICELLVKYLHDEMGVEYDQIAVVVALGTHRKNTAEDRRKLASEFVYDHVASVTDHDCDAPDLVYIGYDVLRNACIGQSAGSRQKGHLHRRYGAPSDGRLRRRKKEHRSRYCFP